MLQIDWTYEGNKFFVFRYENYLFLVPKGSKQAFLTDFRQAQIEKEEYVKKQAKNNKPEDRKAVFWTLAKKYFTKEIRAK
jgi:hypothetical protein